MVRSPSLDKNGLKKGSWSPEEDQKLRAYIQRYGHWNWRQLPKFAGLSRCGKSCRLRWMNYLRPGVKHGNFSEQEKDLIIKLHEQVGNKWSMIAAELPGRTDNEIKNYWHTYLKKQQHKQKQKTPGSKDSSTETSLNRQAVEATDVVANTSSHLLLESSPLSPHKNWNARQNTFQESFGDFWTEPFVLDYTYYQDSYPVSLHDIGGFVSPHDDSSLDWIYQVMQEFNSTN